MWLIISLVIIGAVLLVAELVLLPGLSIAGIGALICYGIAIYFGFHTYGTAIGVSVVLAVIIVSTAVTMLSLRAQTWRKLTLNEQIDSRSQDLPEDKIKVGDKGITITRMAPMGKVEINGETFEAKSLGDKFIDPKQGIEVVGFENFNVIIKQY